MSIEPVGIASLEVLGYPTILPSQGYVNLNTYSQGIASAEAFGSLAVLGSSDPISGIPLYTVFENNVNINAYVRKPSISRNMVIGGGSRSSCSFTTCDKTGGGYRPTVNNEIIVYEGTSRFFAGYVETTEEMWYKGTSGLNEVQVQCTDYGVVCARRVVGKYYTEYLGGIPSVTVSDIVRNFLDDTGITYDWSGTPGTLLGIQLFNYCTVAEAFNQICDKANCDWYIDPWKVLRLFEKVTGWDDAPFTVVDNDRNIDSISVSRSRSLRVNRLGVRNSQSSVALWVDSVTAFAGQTVLLTTYPLEFCPVIAVDGVTQTVVELAYLDTDASDFYYIDNGVGVFYRGTGLAAGQIVEISYPSKLTPVYWAEDLADIALHGKSEAVEDVNDIYGASALGALAVGLLARALVEPIEVSLVTRRKGCEPGQLLTMNMVKPPCATTLLIESVDSEETVELGVPVFRHSIKASNVQLARANRADNFFSKLIERTKQAMDRTTYMIGFTLAETIEGLTNPGLSIGVKPGIRTADKDGVARDVRLYFKSVDDGVLTTDRIVIDIYKNGASIFPTPDASKLVFPIGASEPQTAFFFVSNPLVVHKGDVFTIEILEADPLAMDGMIELVVLG